MKAVCSECGRTASIRGQLEPDQAGNFVCNRCANTRIYLELINFIKTRIAVTRTAYENQGRMVLRELVQNADDAKATILVLRFRSDALYVANDGKAFTTGPTKDRPSDFDRLSQILAQHKAEDKDVTGHFGSGFQTVYVFTNRPEVHSGGRSCRTNPVLSEWEVFEPDDPRCLVSPYEGRKGSQPKGVLFKFPWRTEEAAREEFGKNKRPFLEDAFPRWTPQSRADLYQDLKSYLRHVLLCCKELKAIRLIWEGSGRLEAFQACRDFSFSHSLTKPRVCNVELGEIAADPRWSDWDPTSVPETHRESAGFDPGTPSWESSHQTLRYLVASDRVKDDAGRELHVGKSTKSEEWVITGEAKELLELDEREPNDIHLLFPLFDVQEVDSTDPRAFLYSVIPLPSQSKNLFAFSGHFFPNESRVDVSVASPPRRDGEWHQDIVLSVARLYLSIVERFLDLARRLDVPLEVRQRVVLNAIPACHLSEWMRPGREPSGNWAEALNREVLDRIASLPIIATEAGWKRPTESIWTTNPDGSLDPDGFVVVRWLGHGAFTHDFVTHRNFPTLDPALRSRRLHPARFCELYSSFLDGNGGQLKLGQVTRAGSRVDMASVERLVSYCILNKAASAEMARLAVVPGQDGVLRFLSTYPIIPSELGVLREILPESRLIHPSIEDRLAGTDLFTRSVNPDRALTLVKEVVNDNPDRFNPLSKDDARRFSRLLVNLSSHPDFRLKQAHFGVKFIPIWQHQEAWLAPPNAVRADGGDFEVFLESRPEHYRREFIWVETTEPVPGMTPELRDKIRFLRLEGIPQSENARVASKLGLIALQGGGKPTNFVRQFLSDRQQSLFRDDVVTAFLGLETQTARDSQKKTYLSAFRRYFKPTSQPTEEDPTGGAKASEIDLHPEEIGRIPCLYDDDGTWLPAESFCLSLEPELRVLKYRTLHRDFVAGSDPWSKETLLAMGVARQPSPERVLEQVRELYRHRSENRGTLADIFYYIVTAPGSWKSSLRELGSFDWVPVVGGGYQTLDRTLIPTIRNQQIVGPTNQSLFDSSACSPKFVNHLRQGGAALNQLRAQELHVLLDPPNQMLLDLSVELAASNTDPPPLFFETLRDRFKDASPPAVGATGWFYHSRRWWRGKQVVREIVPPVGEAFDTDLLFLSAEEFDRSRGYLLLVGAHESPEPRILLERLRQLSNGDALEDGKRLAAVEILWTALERLTKREGPRFRGFGPDSISYPSPSGLVPVNKMVLVHDERTEGEFFPEGRYGDWYVVHERTVRYPTALALLGAHRWESMGASDLVDFLESMGSASGRLQRSLLESVTSLLTRIAEGSGRTDLGNHPIWPVKVGDSFRLTELTGVYVGDPVYNRAFENVVPLLCEPDGIRLRARFLDRAFAQSQPCTRLTDSVEIVRQSSSPREGYADGTKRIRFMVDALRTKYPESAMAPKGCFEWLGSVVVSRVYDLTLVARLGTIEKTMEDSCRMTVKEGAVHFDILPWHSALPDDLARLIVDEMVRRGLRHDRGPQDVQRVEGIQREDGVSRSDLESLVYRLLTRPSEDWDLFVTGLAPIHGGPSPLMDEVTESAPGYGNVLHRLRQLYGYCQVCGRKTPEAEGSPETRERLRSIVSERGGRYRGPLERCDLRNSLFLCPVHWTLFERGLVKFPDLEVAREEQGKRARELRALAARWSGSSYWSVDVYEAQNEDQDPDWMSQPLKLDREHAKVMLRWLAEWLEGGDSNGDPR